MLNKLIKIYIINLIKLVELRHTNKKARQLWKISDLSMNSHPVQMLFTINLKRRTSFDVADYFVENFLGGTSNTIMIGNLSQEFDCYSKKSKDFCILKQLNILSILQIEQDSFE